VAHERRRSAAPAEVAADTPVEEKSETVPRQVVAVVSVYVHVLVVFVVGCEGRTSAAGSVASEEAAVGITTTASGRADRTGKGERRLGDGRRGG